MRKPIADVDIGHPIGYDPLVGLRDYITPKSGCSPVLVEFTRPHGWARVRWEGVRTFLVFPENCFSLKPDVQVGD